MSLFSVWLFCGLYKLTKLAGSTVSIHAATLHCVAARRVAAASGSRPAAGGVRSWDFANLQLRKEILKGDRKRFLVLGGPFHSYEIGPYVTDFAFARGGS